MIPQNPCVILQFIEKIDHETPPSHPSHSSSLIHVSYVNKEGMRITLSPFSDLRRTPGKPTHIRYSSISLGWTNMAMKVRSMENRDGPD